MNTISTIRRRVFGMTQTQFADALSVHQSTISRWEADTFPPNLNDLRGIRALAARRGIPWCDIWFFHPPVKVTFALGPTPEPDEAAA